MREPNSTPTGLEDRVRRIGKPAVYSGRILVQDQWEQFYG